MGVIYGYISLTDKPVDPLIAETMRKANSFWGPDGDGLFTCEHAALGSLIMFNTPEAIFEKQPVHFADNQKVLVATARIDNRDDLCRAFDIPLSARDMYPDSYYIRLAYEKWGEECPDHLIGDWSFAVYDKNTRKLFIARDHHGIMACYYYQGPDFFVFSSSLKGILCLPQVEKKVNEYKIAQILVSWNEGGPQTCYMNIFRLPPAHTLTLQNGKNSTNRYWYLENTPEIHLKNDQEYIDMFRELYTEAVRCRLRSYRPVGATLSGGLDSGSVCILASQELAKYGKRLPAFTAVPLYDVPWPKNRIGDEGPLAMALAEKLGNVDVTLCKAENISPLEGVEIMMDVHDQPGFAIGNAYWLIDIINKCYKNKYGTLLIGQGGNGTVSWPPSSILNKNYYYFLWIFMQRIKFLIGQWHNNYIINKKLLVKNKLSKMIRYEKLRPYFLIELDLFDIRNQVVKPGKTNLGNLWFELGLYFKTDVRDPTFDYRLFNFLYGIPKTSKFYNTRTLFENTFESQFPNSLMNSDYRGIQSIDFNERYKTNKMKLNCTLKANWNGIYDYISEKKLFEKINRSKNKSEIVELLTIYSIIKLNNTYDPVFPPPSLVANPPDDVL